MFSPMLSILLVPFCAAVFLAINMGGSGTAPSFSAAYGARIIRRGFIPGLFGIFVFLGAIIAGQKVVLTIGKGILPGEIMNVVLTTIILTSVALALLMANLLRVPQSTSQATVFALVGPALYFDKLKTEKLLLEIIPVWLILPVASFLIALAIGMYYYGPFQKQMKNQRIVDFEHLGQHSVLKAVVVLAACYVAFAIGSNNVANAAGPIACMISNELGIEMGMEGFMLVMIIATFMVAPFFGIGSSFFGRRVVHTTGKEIVEFGPLGATMISIVTASLLLLASVTRGIPTSLVQMNTAAILGLGVTKMGWKKIVSQASVKKILTIWIVTPLIAFLLSLGMTVVAVKMGLL